MENKNPPLPLLHDPPNQQDDDSWFCKIPVIGWHIGGMRQYANEEKLVNQAVERGPVPESAWAGHMYDHRIRAEIENIVRDCAYPDEATFHPLDPFELMMVLRYGDLNEVEIIIAIEQEFGIKLDDAFIQKLVEEQTPFIEFIHYVEANEKPPAAEG